MHTTAALLLTEPEQEWLQELGKHITAATAALTARPLTTAAAAAPKQQFASSDQQAAAGSSSSSGTSAGAPAASDPNQLRNFFEGLMAGGTTAKK
jgi:hypothetical protein